MAEMIIRASVSEGDTIYVGFDKEGQKLATEVKKKY
jgi:ATP-dependent Clp protease ATP-binding subunit ClpC